MCTVDDDADGLLQRMCEGSWWISESVVSGGSRDEVFFSIAQCQGDRAEAGCTRTVVGIVRERCVRVGLPTVWAESRVLRCGFRSWGWCLDNHGALNGERGSVWSELLQMRHNCKRDGCYRGGKQDRGGYMDLSFSQVERHTPWHHPRTYYLLFNYARC